MTTWTIYHNTRCSKSRETLDLLRENGIEPRIVEYLKEVPSEGEIETLLVKLNMSASDLVRKGEALFKQKYKGMSFNPHEWVKIMHEEPKLIERPIVVRNNKAVLGRPPENVMELIEKE